MLEHCRKTVNLLKEHPILLLPLVCASLTDFFQGWLQRVLAREAVNWFTTAHSVLGFSLPASERSFELVKRALSFALPFSMILRLLIFCVYVAGFVLTARVVRNLVQELKPDFADAAIFLRSRVWQIVLFSLEFLAIFIFGMLLASALPNLPILSFLRNDLPFSVLIELELFVWCVCIAWILTPASLRLIADRHSKSVAPRKKTQGLIAAVIVAAVSIVLNHYIAVETPAINLAFESDPWLRHLVIWPAFTILENLPLGLLWVFLGQLVFEDLQLPEIPSPS